MPHMTLSTIHFSQISGNTSLKLPVAPESASPCPCADMDAAFFGWPLIDEQVPTRLVACEGFDHARLGDVRMMELHFILSGRVADILTEFDLGCSRLTRVPLVSANGVEISGPWYHLHIAERKDTLVPLAKDSFDGINKERGLVSGWPDTAPGAIAVELSAETGVDLWRDPMWDFGIFASVRLVETLKAAGLGEEFAWMPARHATEVERADVVMQRQNGATLPQGLA